MTSDEYDRVGRWRATAVTWFRKSTYLLQRCHADETRDEVRWLVGYEAARLLSGVLSDAELLVPLLADDDQFDDVTRELRHLVDALDERDLRRRRERKAAKLAITTGRTPEEAALFAAKASELVQ